MGIVLKKLTHMLHLDIHTYNIVWLMIISLQKIKLTLLSLMEWKKVCNSSSLKNFKKIQQSLLNAWFRQLETILIHSSNYLILVCKIENIWKKF